MSSASSFVQRRCFWWQLDLRVFVVNEVCVDFFEEVEMLFRTLILKELKGRIFFVTKFS